MACQWTPVGGSLDASAGGNAWVRAITVYQGDLIVGGHFSFADGVAANNIARWNGTAWSPLGSGIELAGSVSALATDGTYLFVGGTFETAGGVTAHNIARWNGADWTAIGP